MGIKIRNDTNHDVIVLMFTYLPPMSLYYRTILIIPSKQRMKCPTWQSAIKMYAWEADGNAEAIAERLRRKLSWINAGRLLLAPIGGEVLSAVADTLDVFVDTLIEAAVEFVVGQLQDQLDDSDERFDEMTRQRIAEAQASGRVNFRTSVTKKVFLITQDYILVRRQLSVHRNNGGNLEIDGAGIAWF
ncbi:hypothetical protein THRCLA_22784 [Thraustotheca clavata]|uniref:Uncharacterized protein n=1 Tax=Thraustotheca clavata TaxID=74557 RepID=A0A1V9YTB9_9STRA|nr:hypothetical protein THRCLA_22784 [Thraustotheca clavata]